MARVARRRRPRINARRRKTRKNPYFLNAHRRRSRRRSRPSINARRRRTRTNPYFLNPPRRRRYHSNKRRYRSNPALMGFQLPGLLDVVSVGAGFVVPPIVAGYIMGWLPDSMKTSKAAMWAVKAAAVVVPSMVVRRFVSRRAGNLMLLGGAVSLALDLVKEFAPGLIPGVGFQPLLGAHVVRPTRARMPAPAGLPAMIASTPDRLSPTGRF